jgi:hypothetical protein
MFAYVAKRTVDDPKVNYHLESVRNEKVKLFVRVLHDS